jgi:hypothetical protein
LKVRWTATERFNTRRLLINDDPEAWDQLMRAIEDDICEYPSLYPRLPGTDWLTFKVRPDTEGFPGLTIYFTMEREPVVCVLQDVEISDDSPGLALTEYIYPDQLWEWMTGNGHRAT